MNRKMAIFPIDHHTVTFARYAHLGKYDPIALVSPALSVLDGSDISKLDGGRKANITLHFNYQQKIAESDSVYFLDSHQYSELQLYNELITYAKELNKEVLVSDHLLLKLKGDSNSFEKNLHFLPSKLLKIDVPIISVLAMGENCGQAQTEFSIRKYFDDQGYKVLQIGTQEYSHLLGCAKLPSFLVDANINIQDKIIMFNRFIYEECKSIEPDLVILGVPDPIMKYNNDILNGLGILPFVMQNAILSDVGLINLHYNEYSFEYLSDIMNLCKYRLNIATKYFGISNTTVSKNVDDSSKLEYLYIDYEFVKSNLKHGIGKDEYTLFSIYDEESMIQAFQKIEYELLTNVNQI